MYDQGIENLRVGGLIPSLATIHTFNFTSTFSGVIDSRKIHQVFFNPLTMLLLHYS